MVKNFRLKQDGYELDIEADYDAGRPPPSAKNHDSAAYSDPGDPAECTITELWVDGVLIPLQWLDQNWLGALEERILAI